MGLRRPRLGSRRPRYPRPGVRSVSRRPPELEFPWDDIPEGPDEPPREEPEEETEEESTT